MSRLRHARAAAVFAALGDPTRLSVIEALADGEPHSIADLSRRAPMTRQGLTKHLSALERAGLVRRKRQGRETRYRAQQKGFRDAQAFLEVVSMQWEQALTRLKKHVE